MYCSVVWLHVIVMLCSLCVGVNTCYMFDCVLCCVLAACYWNFI